jgi:hypothetical protein
MSRCVLDSERYEVCIGWDESMRTFFAQVLDNQIKGEDSDRMILWSGGVDGKRYRQPDDLIRMIQPYACKHHFHVLRSALLKDMYSEADRSYSLPPPGGFTKFDHCWRLLYALVAIAEPMIAEIGVTQVPLAQVLTRLQKPHRADGGTRIARFMHEIEARALHCCLLPLESHFGDLDDTSAVKFRWCVAGKQAGIHFPQRARPIEFLQPNDWRVWPDLHHVQQFGIIVRPLP